MDCLGVCELFGKYMSVLQEDGSPILLSVLSSCPSSGSVMCCMRLVIVTCDGLVLPWSVSWSWSSCLDTPSSLLMFAS